MNQLCLFVQLLACTIFRYSFADHTEGCSLQKRAQYISSTLSQECTSSLIALQYHVQPTGRATPDLFVPATSDLDAVCQLSCGGIYSTWLRNDCEDPYSSRMVEAMCIFTSGTTNIGKRCRSAFPDAFDDIRSVFSEVLTCGLGNSLNFCPLQCRTAMNNLIGILGCCYQSLYNNTDFILHLLDIGLINATQVMSLEYLGKATEWDVCNVSVPPMCELITLPTVNSAPNSAPGSPAFSTTLNLHLLAVVSLTAISILF